MAGLDRNSPTPVRIVLHARSRVLEIEFSDGREFRLPAELLRVFSPSAEVRGHGPGQEILQVGKREVGIEAIEPVGHYALQPRFSDGHETGIYSWDYLYELGDRAESKWADYTARLAAAGASRDPVPGAGATAAATGSRGELPIIAVSGGTGTAQPAPAPDASASDASASDASASGPPALKAISVSRPR